MLQMISVVVIRELLYLIAC